MFKVKEGIRIGAQEFVDSSRNVAAGTITASDVTISGELRGPATMYIDPAAVGDNTGTLVIRGNLQVDGTTTTINSTTVAIDDLNIQLAADAPNAAAANGAGITIGGAGATFTYASSGDKWQLNKPLQINSNDGVKAVYDGTDGQTWLRGWGLETDRGTAYYRPTGNASQTLRIGYGEGSQSWATVRVDATTFTQNGNQIWHAGNLTNLNQLTNGPGYITGYTETDTLATVTGRGASTSTVSSFNGGGGDGLPALRINQTSAGGSANWLGSFINSGLNAAAGKWGLLLLGQAESSKNSGYLGFQWQGNSSNSNAVTLGLYAADNLLRVYGGGYTEMSGSSRAPIFYDLDNTGYYLDPNSGTSLVVAGIVKTNADRLVLRDDSIEVHATDNDSAGVAINYYGYASGTTRFRDFNVYDGKGSLRFKTYGAANYAYSPSSFRAPLFYDSDNTGYYLDPNSYSRINTIAIGNQGSLIGGDNTYPASIYHNQRYLLGFRNSSSGTSNYPWLVHDSWNGDAVILHFNGIADRFRFSSGGIGQADSDFRAPIFYDSNDTNYYLDANNTSRLNYLRPNSISLVGQVDNGTPRWDFKAYVVESQHHYGQNGTQTMYLGEDNYIMVRSIAEATSSFRAPIFYDSNDTAFYLNPRHGSRLSGLRLDGIDDAASGDDAILWINKPNNNDWAMLVTGTLDYGIDLRMAASHSYAIRALKNGTQYSRLGSDLFLHDNQIHAPIFYDYNDTNYYVDPNSNSVINTLRIAQGGNTALYIGSGDTSRTYNDGSTRTGISITGYAYPHIDLNATQNGNTTHGAVFSMTGALASGGFRRFGIGVANYNPNEMSFGWYDNDTNPHYGVGVGWTYPASMWFDTGHNLYSRGSMRSPIFYDYNDTGYYADPNSNSRFVNLGLGGVTPDVRLSISGDEHISGILYMGGTAGSVNSWGSRDYTSSGNRYFNANTYEFNNYGYGSTWNFYLTSSYALHTSSVRAPIFYDSDNTGYYCDPNGTSRLNNITLDNGNVQLYKSQTVDMSDTGTYSISNYYPVTIAVPTGGIWIEIQNNLNSNVPSWATHGSGFTLNLRWWTTGSGWGTTEVKRRVEQYHERFTNQTICGGITQMTHSSLEVVWLRGGGTYYFIFSRNTGAEPRSSTYTLNSQSVSPTSSAQNSVWDSASGGHISYNESVYSNILYDWNNTGYYFDGASTTRTNIIQTNYIGVNQGYDPSWRLIVNGNAYLNSGGYGQAEGSWRAPIFYDSNDTNYYLNPDSKSRLNSLCLSDDRPLTYPGILNLGNTSYNYNFQNGSWSSSITAGIMAHCADQWEMAIHDSGTRVVSPFLFDGGGNHRLLMGRNIGWGTMYIEAADSFRAPIFYDSNDTGYYVDPNSTSYQRSLFLGAHDSGSSEFRFGEDSENWYGDRWYWDSGYNVYRYSRYAGTDSLIHYHDTRDASRITYGRNIVFNDYGKGIVGLYDSTRYQGVFAMGDSYKLPANGTTTGSLYGLAWSHPNAGGTAGNLNTHGLLVLENGGFLAAVSGSIRARDDMRAPIFYDSNDTSYYLDPNSTSTSLQIAGTIEQGNNYAHPNIDWGASGTSTGMVIFYIPGDTGNYGMVHMVFDIYEYASPRTSTVIIGGHNWNGGWYNTACNVVGFNDKQVRLGVKDGRYVVVFGTSDSSWSYGQIRLRKIQNGSYYNNIMNLGGNWSTTQTTTESFSYISGDLRNLRTPSALEVDGIIYGYSQLRTPIYYDYNDTGYYCDPNGNSRLNAVYPNEIYNYGWFRNQYSAQGLYNTANDAHFYSAGPNYWHINPDSGSVSVGGLIFYDQYNSTQNGSGGRRGSVYWDSGGFGLLDSTGNWSVNIHPTNYARVTVGGNNGINPYNGVTGIRLMFGGGDDNAAGAYYIGTNLENFGGTYNKLDLRWHTGIRMGAQPGYGGVRIYDTEGLGTVRFSVNKGDAHTRVESGDFYAANLIDRDDSNYYLNPNGSSRLGSTYTDNSYTYGWFRTYGANGLYNESYGNHWYATGNDYWNLAGNNTSNVGIMFRTGGHQGSVRGYVYADSSNNIGFLNSGGSWRLRVVGDDYSLADGSSMRAQIFYDSNNTAYYGDFASTTYLNKLRVNNTTGPSDSVFGTAADVPLHISGSNKVNTTVLIENTTNSSIEYPTIVLRRTSTPSITRFGSLIRFADKNSSGTEVSSQIYSFNRLTSLDLTVESSGADDRVILRAGTSSSFQVAQDFIMNVKAAIYVVNTPAALDIDCKQSNFFTKTINGDSTFTFSNVPAPSGFTIAYSFTLELTHTSGTVTWPASVKWPGNVLPSLTTGKTHLFMFVTDDGGSRWRGSFLSNYDN